MYIGEYEPAWCFCECVSACVNEPIVSAVNDVLSCDEAMSFHQDTLSPNLNKCANLPAKMKISCSLISTPIGHRSPP